MPPRSPLGGESAEDEFAAVAGEEKVAVAGEQALREQQRGTQEHQGTEVNTSILE